MGAALQAVQQVVPARRRLTVAEVSQLERTVRTGIDALVSDYRHRASIGDIAAALQELNVDADWDRGRLSIRFDSIEEVLNFGFNLAQRFPRISGSVIDGARCDFDNKTIWWGA